MWRPIFFSILVIFGHCLEYVAVKWNHWIFKALFFFLSKNVYCNQQFLSLFQNFDVTSTEFQRTFRTLTILAISLGFFKIKCFVSFEALWSFLCGFFFLNLFLFICILWFVCMFDCCCCFFSWMSLLKYQRYSSVKMNSDTQQCFEYPIHILHLSISGSFISAWQISQVCEIMLTCACTCAFWYNFILFVV